MVTDHRILKSLAEAQGRREKTFLFLRLGVTAGNIIKYKEKKPHAKNAKRTRVKIIKLYF